MKIFRTLPITRLRLPVRVEIAGPATSMERHHA
jgi:hypothetical protein